MKHSFDLKHLRLHLGYTQAEMAEILEVSQSTINSYETNPSSITIDKITSLSQKLEIPIDNLIKGYVPEPHAQMNFTYSNDQLEINRKYLSEKLEKSKSSLDHFSQYQNEYKEFGEFYHEANGIIATSKLINKKPTVAFLGKSDSGKSSMINEILGTELSPTHYQPATSSIITIMHSDEKPEYLDKRENTLIFETSAEDGPVTANQIYDKYFKEKHLKDKGDYSLIESYGISKNYGNDDKDTIISIFAFNDAEILTLVNFLDTPGISTGDHEQGQKDTQASEYASKVADIYVYLSVSNQFLHNEDHAYLKAIIDNLDPNQENILDNIFVIASQAYIIDNAEVLSDILDRGSERFFKTLSDIFVNRHGEHFNLDNFRSKMFTFSTGKPEYSDDFKYSLIDRIEHLVDSKFDEAKEFSTNAANDFDENTKSAISDLTDLRENENIRDREFNKLKEQEDQIISGLEDTKNTSIEKIEAYNELSKAKFKETYNEILSEEYILDLISENNFKNNKQDKEELSYLIGNIISDSYEEILTEYAEDFNEDVYERIEGIEVGNAAFDIQRGFISTLVGGLAGGALTLYMSTLGNLGGYILVAKIASWLTAMGISISSVTAVTVVSALGGTVILPITLTAIVAAIVYQLFGGGWKKSFARKAKKEYEKENILGQLLEKTDKFWEDTAQSVSASLDKTKELYYAKLEELKNISGKDADYFDMNINLINNIAKIVRENLVFK